MQVNLIIQELRQMFYYKLFSNFWVSKLFWHLSDEKIWTAPSEFGTNRLCEQRRFRRACASAQSRQNLRCSLIQAVSQEEPSDRKPDPWPLWMAGHAQLIFVMTECSKTNSLDGAHFVLLTYHSDTSLKLIIFNPVNLAVILQKEFLILL